MLLLDPFKRTKILLKPLLNLNLNKNLFLSFPRLKDLAQYHEKNLK